MRILCISDQVDPLVYSSRMKDRFSDIDLVLAAGDLPMEYLGFITSMLNKPLLYVEGNHDLGRVAPWGEDSISRFPSPHGQDEATGALDVGFRFARVEGLTVLGLPGSMRYNRGPNQFTEAQMMFHILLRLPVLLLNRLLRGRACDIVLTHAPPRAIHDRDDPCHRGFRSFNWLIKTVRPRWLIHGHVHLYDLGDVRVTRSLDTTVVNAFGHWVLETEEAAP
jgi:calcineurin-like phosphoesterase family protein